MNINLMVCAGVLLLAGSAAAQDGGKAIPKTTISLGTATPGGGFPLYGNAFAEVMNAADATLAIEPRNTKGSNENIPLLEAGGARYRAGRRRAFLRGLHGHRTAGDPAENPHRDVFEPGHVRGARR
jgi:hypothetical protein